MVGAVGSTAGVEAVDGLEELHYAAADGSSRIRDLGNHTLMLLQYDSP